MLTNANLAVVVIVGSFTLGLGAGFGIDRHFMNAKIDRINLAHTEQLRVREVQRATDERAARTREQTLAARAGQIEQEKVNAITDINRRHADAIARLQNRPDRKPAGTGGLPGAAPACQGATGAELSKQDGQFLAREAARADELRTALSACYAAYDSVGR